MKWQQFENKVKAALQGHKSVVDADAVWAAIEPQVDALNRRKKRRGFVWFWLLGMALALGAWGYFYQTKNSRGDIENMPQKLAAEPVAQNKPVPEVAGNNSAVSNTPQLANKEADAAFSGQHVAKNQVPVRHRAENRRAYIPMQKSGDIAPNILETKPVYVGKTITDDSIESMAEVNKNEASAPTTLPFLPIDLKYIPENKKPELPTYTWEEKPLQPIYRKKYFLSAGIQGSISFVDRNLEAVDTALRLLSLREMNERELEAFQLGLRLTLRHRSGLGLTTGLNFTQINEQYRYYSTVIQVDTVPGIKYLVINLNNDTIPIYGDVPLQTKTSLKKEYYNNYRMFEVPVLAGYHLRHRNFSLAVQAGVFVNLRLSATGRVLETPTQDVDIEAAGIYKSNIGLNYYFGFSAGYFINDNIEAYISPFMRYMPENIAKQSYGLKQSYNLYGVNIGAAWHF
jgi:hypothetical protein